MGLLDRNALLKKAALKIEKVDLGNDEFVYIRQMTAKEKGLFEASVYDISISEDGKVTTKLVREDYRAKLVVNVICDEAGNSLLKPTDAETLAANMSASRMEIIAEAAQKMNQITNEEVTEKAKNSVAGGNGDSVSASAGN